MSQKKNSIYNLLGLGIPLIVGILTIPLLISSLGESKFGILTLVWAIIGYFGIFDLGLGRALTQNLSRAFSRSHKNIVGPIVYTALITVFWFSISLSVTALLVVYAIQNIGLKFLNYYEIAPTLYSISISLPILIVISGLRGVLESLNEFKIINLIRIPSGVFTFIAPLISIYFFGNKINFIVYFLIFGKFISTLFYFYFVFKKLRVYSPRYFFKISLLNPLLYTGGWMTVSNIVSPLMGYIDRFFLGFLISASAVAYYTTPFEVVSKLWIIPGAITLTLFPFFSMNLSSNNNLIGAQLMFEKSIYSIYLIVLPATLIFCFFSFELISLWINPDFSDKSSMVLKIFSFGIFLNCLVHIPFTFLQASGHSKITAIVHIVQLPIFIFLLYILTIKYGLIGTSYAWLLRIIIDGFLMYYYSLKKIKMNYNKIFNFKFFINLAFIFFLFSFAFSKIFFLKLFLLLIVVTNSIYQFRKKILND